MWILGDIKVCVAPLMADYYSILASDKPIRAILSCAKSSKLSGAFGLRSNFKLIVSLRGERTGDYVHP